MPLRTDKLRAYIEQCLDGPIGMPELTEFVQLSRAATQAYLAAFRPWASILCEKQGISITDLSYECISEVFARDRDGAFVHIARFIESLGRPLAQVPDHDLALGFRGLLATFAEAQLARLYALSDPAGAKIHRNVRECLKKGGPFSIERDFRGWILRPASCPALDNLPPYPHDELQREFLARVGQARLIPELLQTLYQFLASQSEYRRSIPLLQVVQLLKEIFRGADHGADEEAALRPALDTLTPFEIERFKLQVEGTLREKILVTYLARGKLDKTEAEAIFLAYRDILDDWCSGDGIKESLYEYLRRHLPIDEATYHNGLRVKMEYLLKIAREEFASRLMKEL